MLPHSKSQIPSSKIAVIGGGLSGLAAAFRLTELKRQGKFDGDFQLIEAGARLGGTIQTVERNGFRLELGADAFLSEKPEAVNLAKRLNLENEFLPTNDENRRAFIVRKGRLRPIPNGFQLLAPSDVPAFFASEILSAHGKTRLANERFLPAAPVAEDESLASFVRRRFGQEALQRIAQPMLAGIYTANPETLSMRATQPRFLDLEQKYHSVIKGLEENSKLQSSNSKTVSGARYSLFLSFKNGMQTLFDGLINEIPADSVRLNSRVTALDFDPMAQSWRIKFASGEMLNAAAVCLALPAFAIAELLAKQFPAVADELKTIEYASTATINFGFRREQIAHALDGFGFVVPVIEKRNLLAATFSSVKFSNRAPDNHVLLRAFVGGAMQPDKFALDDDEMIESSLNDLQELIGLTGKPLFATAARWARSMPQYKVGHLEKTFQIKKLLETVPALTIATTAIDGVGIPDSIRHGETAIDNLCGFFE